MNAAFRRWIGWRIAKSVRAVRVIDATVYDAEAALASMSESQIEQKTLAVFVPERAFLPDPSNPDSALARVKFRPAKAVRSGYYHRIALAVGDGWRIPVTLKAPGDPYETFHVLLAPAGGVFQTPGYFQTGDDLFLSELDCSCGTGSPFPPGYFASGYPGLRDFVAGSLLSPSWGFSWLGPSGNVIATVDRLRLPHRGPLGGTLLLAAPWPLPWFAGYAASTAYAWRMDATVEESGASFAVRLSGMAGPADSAAERPILLERWRPGAAPHAVRFSLSM